MIALKIHPALGMAALKAGHAPAFGLWTLARALDSSGAGRVELDTLREEAACAGLSASRFRRGLELAGRAGMLAGVTRRKDGVEVMVMTSLLRLAQSYGLPSVGAHPVLIPASELRRLSQWKAALWAAWHEGRAKRSGNPISRATMERVTGLPARTQREYEKRQGVTVTRNYCRTQIEAKPGMVEGLREIHPGAFKMRDRKAGRDVLAFPLPNSYATALVRARRGGTRKINAALSGGLSNHGTHFSLSSPDGHRKYDCVFFENAESAERAARNFSRDLPGIPSGMQAARPRTRFSATTTRTRCGGRIWVMT